MRQNPGGHVVQLGNLHTKGESNAEKARRNEQAIVEQAIGEQIARSKRRRVEVSRVRPDFLACRRFGRTSAPGSRSCRVVRRISGCAQAASAPNPFLRNLGYLTGE
jgi:hypothetical protein